MSNLNTMSTIKLLFEILTARERFGSIGIIFAYLILAIFESVGITVLMPFLTVVSDPNVVESNNNFTKLKSFVSEFGIETKMIF